MVNRFANFKEFPQNITSLFSLSMLDLSSYSCIQSLPTIIGELKHLMKRWLRGCENLKELPQSIASFFSLSILDLSFVNPLNHYQ
jgi:hypothetical protein